MVIKAFTEVQNHFTLIFTSSAYDPSFTPGFLFHCIHVFSLTPNH